MVPNRRIGTNGRKRGGQAVVEVLLILPIFLTIVFTIMEMGYLAFWVIMLNHATYECARIGAMIAVGPDDGPPQDVTPTIQTFMSRMITGATVNTTAVYTLRDNQADIDNHDLLVTGTYAVPLVFPISSILLATPLGSGHRTISTTVRMPIEQPLPQ
ncbi:MAG: TadE/TadG family type IV pilus assembly protein [Elusimicrobiota bacterium]